MKSKIRRIIKKLLPLIVLVFCVQLTKGENPDAYRKRQRKAIKLVHTEPSVAKTMLLELLADSTGIPDTIFDYTYKCLGIYYWTAHQLDSSEYFFKKAIVLNKEMPERQAGLLVNLSAVMGSNGNLNKSHDLLTRALSIYTSIHDTLGIGKVYTNLANVYTELDAHDIAVEYLFKTLDLFETDTAAYAKEIAMARSNLANSYSRLGDFSFAIGMYNKVEPTIKELYGPRIYYINVLNKSSALSHLGRGREALDLAEEAVFSLGKIKEFEHLLGYAYLQKAKAYESLGEMDEAHHTYKQAFEYGVEYELDLLEIAIHYLEFLNNRMLYDEVIEVVQRFENTEQYEDGSLSDKLKYQEAKLNAQVALNSTYGQLNTLQKIVKLQGGLSERYNQFVTKELHEKYKTDLLEKERQLREAEIDILKKENAEKRLFVIISILAILIIGAIGVYQWYTRKLKNRIAQAEIQRVNEQNKSLEREASMQEENVKLKEEIIDKQKQQLIASSIEVNTIKNQMESILSNSQKTESLNSLQKSIASLVNDQTFTNRLLDKFKSIDPEFIQKLSAHYPDLTKSELEFCALLKLRLHNKEIAHILQISHESVIKKKYRLSKKLKDNDNADIEQVFKEFA